LFWSKKPFANVSFRTTFHASIRHVDVNGIDWRRNEPDATAQQNAL
jgi:hypothetical protein